MATTEAHAFRQMVPSTVAADYRAHGWWGDITVADLVRGHAMARPDLTAIVADAGRVTWADYDWNARRLASIFIASGFSAGSRLAVLLPDCATIHIVFVAAELAGLTVVGLGARAGSRELRDLLGRTAAIGLVTFAEHRGRPAEQLVADLRSDGLPLEYHVVVPRFEADRAATVLVDGAVAVPGRNDAAIEARRLGPDDLFMINSTSGTTGLPKCVMHTQNRWLYFHQRAVVSGALTADDIFLGAVPTPFGFGLWTTHFTPAVLGSPVVVMERFDADRALELIQAELVTTLCCVSTQFMMMLTPASFEERELSSLRVMFTGGEAVPHDRARAFEQRTGCTLLQFFGSNETGLLSGTTLADTAEQRLGTAGKVIPEMNVRLYEGDQDVTGSGRGQPAGRGPATCLGYLDDPTANAELFTSDGWMLMADICELDVDGYLTVVGRKSDIIIRGGKNISAVQVENAVASHPAVRLAAAVPQSDPLFGERVCVFVELIDGASLSFAGLIDHLRERGTSREIFPEQLEILDHLPRSSGDKVAKGELRARLAQV